MIHSMTAYARQEIKGDWGTGTWEIRSVKPTLSGNLHSRPRAISRFRTCDP